MIFYLFIVFLFKIDAVKIGWYEYLKKFEDIKISEYSFIHFNSNSLCLDNEMGITPYLHVNKLEFYNNFIYISNYYSKVELIDDRNLWYESHLNYYFSYLEKEITFHYEGTIKDTLSFIIKNAAEASYKIEFGNNININVICHIEEFLSPYNCIKENKMLIESDNINIFNGPIIVELSLNMNYMQYYDGRITELQRESNLANYYALIVGFGNNNGIDYFIIQTSFNKEWGYKGCIRVMVGTDIILSAYQIKFE